MNVEHHYRIAAGHAHLVCRPKAAPQIRKMPELLPPHNPPPDLQSGSSLRVSNCEPPEDAFFDDPHAYGMYAQAAKSVNCVQGCQTTIERTRVCRLESTQVTESDNFALVPRPPKPLEKAAPSAKAHSVGSGFLHELRLRSSHECAESEGADCLHNSKSPDEFAAERNLNSPMLPLSENKIEADQLFARLNANGESGRSQAVWADRRKSNGLVGRLKLNSIPCRRHGAC